MQDIAKRLVIEGSGTIEWSMPMDDGTTGTLKLLAYYIPGASQHLLSPQHLAEI